MNQSSFSWVPKRDDGNHGGQLGDNGAHGDNLGGIGDIRGQWGHLGTFGHIGTMGHRGDSGDIWGQWGQYGKNGDIGALSHAPFSSSPAHSLVNTPPSQRPRHLRVTTPPSRSPAPSRTTTPPSHSLAPSPLDHAPSPLFLRYFRFARRGNRNRKSNCSRNGSGPWRRGRAEREACGAELTAVWGGTEERLGVRARVGRVRGREGLGPSPAWSVVGSVWG